MARSWERLGSETRCLSGCRRGPRQGQSLWEPLLLEGGDVLQSFQTVHMPSHLVSTTPCGVGCTSVLLLFRLGKLRLKEVRCPPERRASGEADSLLSARPWLRCTRVSSHPSLRGPLSLRARVWETAFPWRWPGLSASEPFLLLGLGRQVVGGIRSWGSALGSLTFLTCPRSQFVTCHLWMRKGINRCITPPTPLGLCHHCSLGHC